MSLSNISLHTAVNAGKTDANREHAYTCASEDPTIMDMVNAHPEHTREENLITLARYWDHGYMKERAQVLSSCNNNTMAIARAAQS